jgi:hypothetical protein
MAIPAGLWLTSIRRLPRAEARPVDPQRERPARERAAAGVG